MISILESPSRDPLIPESAFRDFLSLHSDKSSTASVVFSLHKSRTEETLRCLQPHSFPILFQAPLVCGAQARRSTKRWGRERLLAPPELAQLDATGSLILQEKGTQTGAGDTGGKKDSILCKRNDEVAGGVA